MVLVETFTLSSEDYKMKKPTSPPNANSIITSFCPVYSLALVMQLELIKRGYKVAPEQLDP